MTNWKALSKQENKSLWDQFQNKFPLDLYSWKLDDLESIPLKGIKFDTTSYFGSSYSKEKYQKLEYFLIDAFKSLVSSNEKLYAIDLHHQGYSFEPYKKFERDKFGEWLVPARPNGDITVFLDQGINNFILGDGFSHFLFFSGTELMEFLSENNFPK